MHCEFEKAAINSLFSYMVMMQFCRIGNPVQFALNPSSMSIPPVTVLRCVDTQASLYQYERIIYMDADSFPIGSMDNLLPGGASKGQWMQGLGLGFWVGMNHQVP